MRGKRFEENVDALRLAQLADEHEIGRIVLE